MNETISVHEFMEGTSVWFTRDEIVLGTSLESLVVITQLYDLVDRLLVKALIQNDCSIIYRWIGTRRAVPGVTE